MAIREDARTPNGIQTGEGVKRYYVPLDVNFPDDPAVMSVSLPAQMLYVRSLCRAKKLETDGVIYEGQLRALCFDLGDYAALALELYEAGLFADARANARGRAWTIPSWGDWNPSKAELEAKREKDRERKRRGGDARARSERNPEVEEEEEPRERARESFSDEFETCWKLYPRKLNRKGALKAYQARRREGVSFSDLLDATTAYSEARAGENPDYSMHGATFYGPNERWKDFLEAEPAPVVPRTQPPCPDHGTAGACFFQQGQGWVHVGVGE